MGYDLHFTRADFWPDSAMYPISFEEWSEVADAEPRIERHQEPGKRPVYGYLGDDGYPWEWALLDELWPRTFAISTDEVS